MAKISGGKSGKRKTPKKESSNRGNRFTVNRFTVNRFTVAIALPWQSFYRGNH
jgi:hypothetical protein